MPHASRAGASSSSMSAALVAAVHVGRRCRLRCRDRAPAAALVAARDDPRHGVARGSGELGCDRRGRASLRERATAPGGPGGPPRPNRRRAYVWAGERQAATTEDARGADIGGSGSPMPTPRRSRCGPSPRHDSSVVSRRPSLPTSVVRTRRIGIREATCRSEQVPSEHVTGDGKTAVLLRARFDESVLGGSDNANEVGLSARRDGAAVVLAVTATSGQTIGPRSATRPADDLAGAMLRAIRRR